MASLGYLWARRAKFPLNSGNFYRAWGKRFFLLHELLFRNRRRWLLMRSGAVIDESAEIGEVTVEGNKANLIVGARSFLGKAFLAAHAPINIGERVCVNDGVRILTASHDVADSSWSHTLGPVTIEDYAWVGMGAIILPGVHIGRGAVVGAGAVVSKSVPAGAIAVGNPARLVQKTRSPELNYDPCESLAANRAWLLG